ncbi:MAG: hypothetical protein ACI84D_001492, partial [Thalassolituus oleivorans]
MKRTLSLIATTLLTLVLALTLSAPAASAQNTEAQYTRPAGKAGINMFEPGKTDNVGFKGLGVKIGGAFAQQFQSLTNENSATPNIVDGTDLNAPEAITGGFNLATANLVFDVQLADGIKVNLVSYLSSRHHQETWVKGGFLQIDKLPWENEALSSLMEITTVRAGHFEVNYGDGHLRRTDNG